MQQILNRLRFWQSWYDAMDEDDRKYSIEGRLAYQNIINYCHAIASQTNVKASKDEKPDMGNKA